MYLCGRLRWLVGTLLLYSVSAALAGTPNFDGVWERFPDPYGPGPFAENPPPPGGQPRLREPYAAAYEAILQRDKVAKAEGKQVLEASAECLPEGMPTIMGAVYDIQILQTPKELVVLAEFLAQTRRVYLNEKMPPANEIMPSYSGYSVGHWEGDTLVVRTLGVREDTTFFDFPHSKNMVITEWLRLTAPGRLEDRVRIDDPTVLAKPYEFTYGYKKDPTYKIQEYICDGNRYSRGANGTINLDVAPN